MATWEHTKMTINGKTVEAQAPIIVSASRSTDIPAFYADWFFDRLQKGYSAWKNPFNGIKSYISYDKTRFIVFWSKNPRPLIQYLPVLKEKNIKYYIQYTLNDYEQEHFENVPPLHERIETFKMLAEQLGKEAVVWRFDPLFLADDISIDDLLERIQNIGDQLKGYTEKLVFSFADIAQYKKVKHNLEVNGIPYHEWEEAEMEEFASRLSSLNERCGWNFQLATCGEKIALEKYGILHNRCIDGDLITRIAWNDKELMNFMKVKIENVPMPQLFGEPELPKNAILLPDNHYFISKHKKDAGQRDVCQCMASKDIGEYNTCPHLCEYCYANTSKQRAISNWRRHQKEPYSEAITGEKKITYSELICDCKNIDDIINVCHEAIPQQYKAKPWTHPELGHGQNLLSSEDALNCYMSAYGDMHVTKCRAAMMNFPFHQLEEGEGSSIEIVDWGCGQGIGTATIVDILQQHNLLDNLKKITLIEPSKSALIRATKNIERLTSSSIEIDAKNKYLPAKGISEEQALHSVGYRFCHVIHIFSNVLDIPSIDLGAVAHMVAASHGQHFIVCVGPKNSAGYRIERFCSVFGHQEFFSKIEDVCYGRTKRTAYPFTCMTRCFSYDGAPIDLSRISLIPANQEEVFNEYDLRLQIQNKVLSPQKARIAWRLGNILAIDDIMYINPVVNEVAVDFIIVRPNKGILIVNVFEENLANCSLSGDNSKKESIFKKDITTQEKSYKSPFDLISLCQSSIKDGIEELLINTINDNRSFSIIKKVIVFPENSTEQVEDFFGLGSNCINYTYIFGNEFIIDKNVSLSLYKTIGFLNYNKTFDDVVKQKLAEIISPSWHSYQEGRDGLEPVGAQKKLSESSTTQQKISGVAGAGKTQVLAFRAINAMKRTGGNVLILTYNITLANYMKFRLSEIREDFSWEKIDIYPYHQFFRIRAAECQLHVNFDSYENVDFFNNAKNHKKYAAIFIDEVQDYTTEWMRIIMKNFLLDPNGEIAVFGDPKQNVYRRPLDANGDIRLGVIGGVWNRQLTTGRRFTNPRLAKLATDFQTEFMPEIPTDNISTDKYTEYSLLQKLNYIYLRSDCSYETIINNVNQIISNNNEDVNFVILASSTTLLRDIDYLYRQQTNKKTETTFASKEILNTLQGKYNVTDNETVNWKFSKDLDALERIRKQRFTTGKRCLKISTIQSFKGWESPSVILLLESEKFSNGKNFLSPQIIYTAITRARESLYIINLGNDNYHNFFQTINPK